MEMAAVYTVQDYAEAPFHPNRTKDELKRLKGLSKPELQQEARRYGVQEEGTKAEIIDRIKNAL